mgnify:CR=1 FL=1
MSDDFKPGLEGVIAFESEIAEPDKEGSALRYRGVDIEDLVGKVSFGNVWGLLVDDQFNPGLPSAEKFPLPVHSGDVRVDVQSAIAMLAPAWGFKPLLDISDEEARDQLARASVMVLSYVAQSARGYAAPAVPESEIDKAHTVTERMMIRWRGEPDPKHVRAVDAYFVSAAEHGMNASTFTARVIASTGADVAASLSGAIGAMSGPLHGGAPSRVLHMIEEVEKRGDARAYVKELLDMYRIISVPYTFDTTDDLITYYGHHDYSGNYYTNQILYNSQTPSYPPYGGYLLVGNMLYDVIPDSYTTDVSNILHWSFKDLFTKFDASSNPFPTDTFLNECYIIYHNKYTNQELSNEYSKLTKDIVNNYIYNKKFFNVIT